MAHSRNRSPPEGNRYAGVAGGGAIPFGATTSPASSEKPNDLLRCIATGRSAAPVGPKLAIRAAFHATGGQARVSESPIVWTQAVEIAGVSAPQTSEASRTVVREL
jgi:hypothetical protein